MSLLDDVFEVLQIATRLEATGMNRIEAATKVCAIGVDSGPHDFVVLD